MAQPAQPPAVGWREPASNVYPLEAVERQHARDRMALAMENAALCRQLRELGEEPVSKSTDDWVAMYEVCSAVVRVAADLHISLGKLIEFLGTSKEMLEEFS